MDRGQQVKDVPLDNHASQTVRYTCTARAPSLAVLLSSRSTCGRGSEPTTRTPPLWRPRQRRDHVYCYGSPESNSANQPSESLVASLDQSECRYTAPCYPTEYACEAAITIFFFVVVINLGMWRDGAAARHLVLLLVRSTVDSLSVNKPFFYV